MTYREEEEERNKRIGWITTVSVQLVLLVICYLIIAWREPDPPIPEYGIELGFETSSGAPAAGEEALNESSSANASEAEQAEQPLESEPAEESPNESPSEVSETQASETAQPLQDPVINEVAEEVEVTTETQNTSVQTPKDKQQVETPAEQAVPVKTQGEEEAKKVETRAMMGEKGKSEKQQLETEGQSLDNRAIYGKEGTDAGKKEGANLSLSGWLWDFEPKPDDQSNETGKIVFSIEVDEEGNLKSIALKTSTLSPSVAQKYREAVQKLTFSKTAEYRAAEISKGTITFIITSK